MKKLFPFILLLIIFCTSSCEKEKTPYDSSNVVTSPIYIRIHNVTSFYVDSVNVNSEGTFNWYYDLSNNEFSNYQKFESAYDIANASIYFDSLKLPSVGYCTVGEDKLPTGNYTFALEILGNGAYLHLEE